jgi:hypothetical protein
MVMKLLGWRISMSEDKRLPFGIELQMLGAIVDLSLSANGVIKVKNKPSRIDDIGALVEDLCSKDSSPLFIKPRDLEGPLVVRCWTPLVHAPNLRFN